MAEFISVPLKTGYHVEFFVPLRNFVTGYYGSEVFIRNKDAFVEFINKRINMINKVIYIDQLSVTSLTSYYDQLVSLMEKIPMDENGLRIEFKWGEAFKKESILKKKAELQKATGEWERICILFNIAACYSKEGLCIDHCNEEPFINAANYFQRAAGIFSYLASVTPTMVPLATTNDLNPDTLMTLRFLMVAQAQEVIYIKAVKDKINEDIVAKIAEQAACLYGKTLGLMKVVSVKSILPKDWILNVTTKEAGYHAVAEYYQAKFCFLSHKFGEQIARLKKASGLLKTVRTRTGTRPMFLLEQLQIEKDLETMEKENDIIYHDSIPEMASLSAISKEVLAGELPLESPINKDFKDLFANILPFALLSKIQMFEIKQREMVHSEIDRLMQATFILNMVQNSKLSSFRSMFQEALDKAKNESVTNVLLERSVDLRKKGGSKKIDEMLKSLTEPMQRSVDIFNEASRMIDEEGTLDKELKEQFNDRWNRTPSAVYAESWLSEVSIFKKIIKQAQDSDDVIRNLYEECSSFICILSQNDEMIRQSIENFFDLSNIEKDVKQFFEEIEKMKEVRLMLIDWIKENEIKNFGIEVTKVLTENGSLVFNESAFIEQNREFEPFKERVQESLTKQQELMSLLPEKISKFRSAKEAGTEFTSSLMLTIDKYNQMYCNLEEGLKFYRDLTEVLINFERKVTEFCMNREKEKDQLLKDIQTAEVFQAVSATQNASNNSGDTTQTNQTIRLSATSYNYR